MNATDVNALLASIIIMAATLIAIVWLSPKGAESVSRYLLARATALRAARRVYREEFNTAMQAPGKAE